LYIVSILGFYSLTRVECLIIYYFLYVRALIKKVKVKVGLAVNGSIPWHCSYGVWLAIWHHTVLPATRQSDASEHTPP